MKQPVVYWNKIEIQTTIGGFAQDLKTNGSNVDTSSPNTYTSWTHSQKLVV
jgi:hypothetical protein